MEVPGWRHRGDQYAEQLAPAVRAALFGNVGYLVAFRVGHRDARILTPEFTGAVPQDLLELGLGECMARIGTDWTRVRTLPPPGRQENDPTARIVAAARRQFTERKTRAAVARADAAPEEGEFVQ